MYFVDHKSRRRLFDRMKHLTAMFHSKMFSIDKLISFDLNREDQRIVRILEKVNQYDIFVCHLLTNNYRNLFEGDHENLLDLSFDFQYQLNNYEFHEFPMDEFEKVLQLIC